MYKLLTLDYVPQICYIKYAPKINMFKQISSKDSLFQQEIVKLNTMFKAIGYP